jgi:predicted alpha/beta-hydrolase family hydrolase
MAESSAKVDVGEGRTVSVLKSERQTAGEWTFVYAPGAGSSLKDPFGAFLAGKLPSAGISLVRFQFPYSEAGRSAPDRPPVLEATWRAVVEAMRRPDGRLSAGGRSMGGRIASQAVAAGLKVDHLALFAYPLHPPGRPEMARVAHLASIGVTTLFCSGTRDAFATPEELAAAAAFVPNASIHILEGADHGFNVLKSSGRTRAEVWAEVAQALIDSILKN